MAEIGHLRQADGPGCQEIEDGEIVRTPDASFACLQNWRLVTVSNSLERTQPMCRILFFEYFVYLIDIYNTENAENRRSIVGLIALSE